jgi:hypothetical protein
MTDPTVSDIEARLRKATPGEWLNIADVDDPAARCVVVAPGHILDEHMFCRVPPDDAAFIANAKPDIAFLLSELKARDKRIGELENQSQTFQQAYEAGRREIEGSIAAIGDAKLYRLGHTLAENTALLVARIGELEGALKEERDRRIVT